MFCIQQEDSSAVDVAKRRLRPRGGAVAEAGRRAARALQGRSARENQGSRAVEQSRRDPPSPDAGLRVRRRRVNIWLWEVGIRCSQWRLA